MPGPGGRMDSRSVASSFEKVFENDCGTLYRNPVKVDHVRKPLTPAVSLPLLVTITGVCLVLVLADLLFARHPRVRLAVAGAGTLAIALCLVPLATTAWGELRNPPTASAAAEDGPPGGGPPGLAPPGAP